jgi:hypothetical protein
LAFPRILRCAISEKLFPAGVIALLELFPSSTEFSFIWELWGPSDPGTRTLRIQSCFLHFPILWYPRSWLMFYVCRCVR